MGILNPIKTFEPNHQKDIRNQMLFENIRRLKIIGILGSLLNVLIISISYRSMGSEGLFLLDSVLRILWIVASLAYIIGVGRPKASASLTVKHRAIFLGAASLSLFFSSLITGMVSVNNGYIFLYIINCMLTASFLYLSFIEMLMVLLPSILCFAYVLLTISDTALNNVGNLINILAATVFGILIATMSYQDRVAILDAQQVINQHNKNLQDLAEMDGLTLIPNRRKFDQVLSLEWAHAERSQVPLSILMMDVDYFKHYNDTYGHLAGDDCLRQIARLLSAVLKREIDCVCRYGGEEFIAILPETDKKAGFYLAEQLRQKVFEQNMQHEKSPLGVVTISIGVATLTHKNFDSKESLIDAADKAMYESKRLGRNCVS